MSVSMRHAYDSADRLTKTCFRPATTCTAANQTIWSYNRVGSRLTEKVGTAPVSTYTYDVADQLTAITGPGAATFTYNANGDQLTAGTDVFTYNTARQTTSATVSGVTSSFAYDGNGNRSSVTTGGVVTSEVWDTQGGLPTLVAQRDSVGVVSRRYTYVGSSPLKFEEGATAGYYLTDGLGSVSNMTTTTGAVGATYRYSPYGTARAATSVLPAFASNPLRYTGQQLDATGNYNLRARHYNPNRGAFTQTDPWTRPAGSTAEAGYVYTGSNPMVFVDVSGMCRSSTLRRLNPIASFGPSSSGRMSDDECGSLFEEMWRFTQRLRSKPGKGTLGLEARFAQMFAVGVKNGRDEFETHVREYKKQQRGLNNRIDEWEDNDCDDRDPPSSSEVAQINKIYQWASKPAPSWGEITLALSQSQQQYQAANGSPGPRPTSEPFTVPWRQIAIGALVVTAAPLIVGAVVIAAVGAGLGSMGGAPPQYA
jgi:RHS repeat-associated protein